MGLRLLSNGDKIAQKYPRRITLRLKRFLLRNLGITALIVAVAFRVGFSLSSAFFNSVYFNFLFPAIRNTQSALSFIWIVPGLYVGLILILIWLIFRFPRKRNWKQFFKRLSNLIAGVIALFLLLWGFNYANVGYATRVELPPLPDSTFIAQQYLHVMNNALEYRTKIEGLSATESIESLAEWPADSAINTWIQSTLLSEGYPVKSKIRVRHIKPDGVLRRLSITGIYNPYSGEANVDASLPKLVGLFTTAHEIAHAYGVTSEAEANFVAYLACIKSGNARAQYAAEYALWRYFAAEINRTFPEESLALLAAKIPKPLRIDRRAIRESYYKYRGYFPEFSDAVNDTYLKLQGISSGTQEYNDFLKLYLRWKQKSPKMFRNTHP